MYERSRVTYTLNLAQIKGNARPFIHYLYFIYARKLRVHVRKNYVTVEIHL